MSTLLSQITVLVIVAIVVFTVLAIFGYLPKSNSRSSVKADIEKSHSDVFNGFSFNEKKNDFKTSFMNFWIMEQLDDYGKPLKVFEISQIPEKGLSIGCAADCDFQVTGSRFVGRHHAVIGQDEKGLFIQDCNSTNGIFDENQKKVKQMDIKDGMFMYLANVRVRFRTVNPFTNKVRKENPAEKNVTEFFSGKVKRM
jgi:hypothetical protein